MKINKKIITAVLVFVCAFNSFSFIVLASDTNYGLNTTIKAGDGDKSVLTKAFSINAIGGDAGAFLSTRLGSIIGTLLSFLGVIFMALVLYGGILWMTARGNESQVDKAKELLVNAIIGLIIVLAAYAITAFVGGALTDVQPATDATTQTATPQ